VGAFCREAEVLVSAGPSLSPGPCNPPVSLPLLKKHNESQRNKKKDIYSDKKIKKFRDPINPVFFTLVIRKPLIQRKSNLF